VYEVNGFHFHGHRNHSSDVKHIVSRTKVWNFRIFKLKYLMNHLSPNRNFDGSELSTSSGMQANQNFENRSDYHILQFSRQAPLCFDQHSISHDCRMRRAPGTSRQGEHTNVIHLRPGRTYIKRIINSKMTTVRLIHDLTTFRCCPVPHLKWTPLLSRCNHTP
jgi:hypothetical protein